MPQHHAIQIHETDVQDTLSPAQKRFNRLIRQIDNKKKTLAQWYETLDRCHQEAAICLKPLQDELAALQERMVRLLDAQLRNHKFTQTQQEKLRFLICELCTELIEVHGRDEFVSLYDKHSDTGFDEQAGHANELVIDILRLALEEHGIDADEFIDEPTDDPQRFAEQIREKLLQQEELHKSRRTQRKKTARQRAKEQRERDEASKISKSIQSVYRQLAALLHPDREQDPEERARKTELMQKANIAYRNKDLIKLLELQLSAEQIDQSKLNTLDEERLSHFNKVLQKQHQELRDELRELEMQTRVQLNVSPYEKLTPKKIAASLKHDIQSLRYKLIMIQRDLTRFQNIGQLKKWLNRYRIPEPAPDPFFGPF